MLSPPQVARLSNALPFWLSLAMVPLPVIGAVYGGWTVLLAPVVTWYLYSIVDALSGLNEENADPETGEDQLFWYRLITMIWAPVQFVLIFGLLAYVPQAAHLNTLEKIMVFVGTGVLSGTIGIVYSHELLHQRNRFERWLGDILLAMVLYSHFRSEHLLVHHRYVGTPRDPVTARYNEGFHRFYFRVLPQCLASAFAAEKAMLARRKLPWWHRTNPFWRYWALQAAMLGLAAILGGWSGIGLLLVQAGVAVWTLELTNYVEHYGLTRKHLGDGKYEHVLPRHSWNASHRASNWLLINLQRHSDHHYKPDRRFPLLQTYSEDDAPQLPYGYMTMTFIAVIPPLWRRVMNPKVRKWRQTFYPEITDWAPYKSGTLPLPR
ncbi:alkane 1-monooxygenase [Histidinibacterium aquaticum]|uniref:Alkane 1-monooxygenase n=1 Tax=Histidinibacterium aquaticum TaxID=2613962 RepID=A0A5J5GD27_9RHOB|nr:alkane 1-monooxygenase [Histidinibacterium aquaticum]KAA9005971.1 alkane 1-monooxygenase [Histidinibacterium aquaticum]